MTFRVYADAVGFSGPGLASCADLFDPAIGAALPNTSDWEPQPSLLPKRQARRLSKAIRTAIAAAEQISGTLDQAAPWVFASSSGEGETLNHILAALSQPEIMLQPLRFQNAVHNAAQGQLSIAAGSTGPATSIAAYDASFAAGLLKAIVQMQCESTSCGLVAFDEPLPPPLHQNRPYEMTIAGAVSLSPVRSKNSIACLTASFGSGERATSPADLPGPALILDSNNPVRFMLPFLGAVCGVHRERLVFDCSGSTQILLEIEVFDDA